jgi:import inner membrane translocase subunit TIM44
LTIEESTEPIQNTAAYKTLSETLVDAMDDSDSAKHVGFKEERREENHDKNDLPKQAKTVD